MTQAACTFDVPPVTPWYRHRWPWLLMLGPGVVVVAGFVTLWLALRSDDGVVADDHYKRGLAINQTLARAARGAELGLAASVDVSPDGRATVALHGRGDLPPVVRLRLVHPTRAGLDQSAELVLGPDGRYAGRLDKVQPGRWLVIVETAEWRVGAVEASGPPVRVDLSAQQP
jgi:hypothetical protein